jgi:hypothetical protein
VLAQRQAGLGVAALVAGWPWHVCVGADEACVRVRCADGSVDVEVEEGLGERGGDHGHASSQPRAVHSRGRVLIGAVAMMVAACLGLVAVAAQRGALSPSVMPQFQYTTTSTIACGCCGAVGCYCTSSCGTTGLAGMPYGGPPLGTQAAVTPDWTDVVTSLTREVSEDTAEIAGLKATVARLSNWQKQSEPRIEYLTHVQKWMREHPGGQTLRQQAQDMAQEQARMAAGYPAPAATEAKK